MHKSRIHLIRIVRVLKGETSPESIRIYKVKSVPLSLIKRHSHSLQRKSKFWSPANKPVSLIRYDIRCITPRSNNLPFHPITLTDTSKLLSVLSILAVISASPIADAARNPNVSVNVYADNACAVPDVEGYSFTQNNQCHQFIEQEGSFTATSNKPVPGGCVLQVFASTNCENVLAAITINGGCEAPLFGPASSGKLVGC